MKKKLNTEGIANELAGASLFFYPQNRVEKRPVADTSLPEKPVIQPKTGKPKGLVETKEASPQARKPEKLSSTLTDLEKVEKYTTHLEPSLVKKIKLAAIDKDIKDYDVVRIALKEYFEKNI
jgi:hypothetical protein